MLTFSFALRCFIFLTENLAGCASIDGFQTFYYFIPLAVTCGIWFVLTLLPSYQTQRGVLAFLNNMVLADITLNLMLHSMTRRKFNPVLQKGLLFALVPIVVIIGLGLDGQAEKLIIQGATVLSFLNFSSRVAFVSKQYYDYSNRSFWFTDRNPAQL